MELHTLKAYELKSLIENKEVKVAEVTEAFLNRIEKVDEKIGAYLYVGKDEALKKAKELDDKISKGEKLNSLYGVPVGIKDNISVKAMQNTCGSKILQGYISPYDATVVEKIKNNDGIILGKINMDEFAMGFTNENSAYKKVHNPWNLECVPGGSSGGSAAAVAALEVPLTLGTDTGGSVRQPAAFCGVVGVKPTYGRVSRYGVVAFGSTLDQVGTFGRDVKDAALLTETISGIDKNDYTTVNKEVPSYTKNLSSDIRGKRIGVAKEFLVDCLDDKVRNAFMEAIEVLKSNGAIVEEVSLPLSKYALADYYIISSAEASSNLARFDGIRYGYRSENSEDAVDIYIKSRSEALGREVKRRIILGTYVLSAGYYDAYYKKALKVRTLIKEDYSKIFKNYDAIISPTSPSVAFKFGEKGKNPLDMCLADMYTVPVNIAGLPAISLPCGNINGLPVGLQIIGDYFKEDILFNIAYSYEQSTNWHKTNSKVD